ncbi:MAG: hypothetical protein H6577_27310 [Lewinellaceae bacterium]|nr:hypothetical protein [Saprospiraceae bacterium]MCB9341853.1 hypothetical protein [Lewinellaceae bacterium]
MESKKDKIQWFEWAMLFVAIGIIAVSIYYVEGNNDADMATNNDTQNQEVQVEEQPVQVAPIAPLDQRLLQPASSRNWNNLGLERRTYSRPNNLLPIYPLIPTPTIPEGMDTSGILPVKN